MKYAFKWVMVMAVVVAYEIIVTPLRMMQQIRCSIQNKSAELAMTRKLEQTQRLMKAKQEVRKGAFPYDCYR